MRTRTIRSLIYLAAGIGLIIAFFAVLEYYEASLRSLCTISQFFSCATVDQSGKTSTLGIPDYLIGVGGFIVMLVVAGIAESRPRERAWPYLLLLITTLGVGFSAYFLYVQLVEIGAFCVVCASAEAFGGLAWVGSILLVRAPRPGGKGPPTESPEGEGA